MDDTSPDRREDSLFAITIGAGRTRPKGHRLALGDRPTATAFVDTLRSLPPENDGWFSVHLWEDDTRAAERWRGAHMLAADLDFHDAEGKHAAVPDDRRRMIESALSLLAPNVYYPTPRGARLVLVLARPVTDPARYRNLGRAYARRVARILLGLRLAARRQAAGGDGGRPADAWVGGFHVDEAVSTDLARILFRPNARVDGVARVGDLRVCADEPVDEEVVAAWADEDAEEDPVAVGGSIDDAVARYNTDHPRDYPESHGECPACGHGGCFGRLPDAPGRWVCFSTDHGTRAPRCGLPGNACHHGDALDLDARAAGISRTGLLERDGYCAPEQATQEVHGAPASGKRFMRTDLGNAERLVHRHGGQFRYCHEYGRFYAWTGRRWVPDQSGRVMRLAARTIRDIYREAAAANDKKEAVALAGWAKASESRPRLEAMVALARSMKGIAVVVKALDSDPWLFNCGNGTVDLRAGTLQPHRREDLITKLAPVEHRPDATCPLFDEFMRTTFSGNTELIEFVLRLLGMSLTGDVREQLLPIFHGAGNNGKSVLLDTVAALMGDHATEAPPDLLVVPKGERHATELADLCGRRLVVASETEEGSTLRLQLVKRLTGNARIKGRFMRQDFFEFERTHKLILVTNNKPRVKENTEAAWRRLRLVPFDHIVPKEKRDKGLLQKLRAEWPGILAKLVAACLRWQRDGLTEPEAVLVATEQYRNESDEIALFVSECCVTTPTAWAPSAALREEYEGWCKDRGTRPFGGRAFTDRLRERGFKPEKRTDRGWLGVGLRAE